jgi:hypothetical protein
MESNGSGLILSHDFLEEMRAVMKYLSQHSRPLYRDLNPGPPEYEAAVLIPRRRSVCVL